MPKQNFALLVLLLTLCACNKSQPGSTQPASSANPPASALPTTTSAADDPVQQKLREIAGSGAVDCGRHEIQAPIDELKTASNCALDAAKARKPFFVGYNMPGMTNAIAGNAAGKLFSVQLQGSGTGSQVASGDCPAELRVASSGRVTCFAQGAMSLGNGGPDPHAGMALKPGGANPHSGLGIPEPMAPPPGHPATQKNN